MLLFIMFLYSFLGAYHVWAGNDAWAIGCMIAPAYHVWAGNDAWAIGCMIVSIIALASDAIVTEIKRGRTK